MGTADSSVWLVPSGVEPRYNASLFALSQPSCLRWQLLSSRQENDDGEESKERGQGPHGPNLKWGLELPPWMSICFHCLELILVIWPCPVASEVGTCIFYVHVLCKQEKQRTPKKASKKEKKNKWERREGRGNSITTESKTVCIRGQEVSSIPLAKIHIAKGILDVYTDSSLMVKNEPYYLEAACSYAYPLPSSVLPVTSQFGEC